MSNVFEKIRLKIDFFKKFDQKSIFWENLIKNQFFFRKFDKKSIFEKIWSKIDFLKKFDQKKVVLKKFD